MNSIVKLVAVALGVVLVQASGAFANQAPSFVDMIERMQAERAAQPPVQNMEYSEIDTSVSSLMASIQRQASNPVIPFTKLAMQYVQGNSVTAAAGDDQSPFIMVAGYWDTQVNSTTGGKVTMVAYVTDPQGDTGDSLRVEIYLNQQSTGIFLEDSVGPFPQGDDGVYGWEFDVVPPDLLPAGQYLLELVATDSQGNQSGMWPYLEIYP